jgi:hypothetical protein
VIKHTTEGFVFKFVGGEEAIGVSCKRLCHYCRKAKAGGMICVYNNFGKCGGIMVCPACAVEGCRQAEAGWKILAKRKTQERSSK